MSIYLQPVSQKDRDVLARMMDDYLGELCQYKDVRTGPGASDDYEHFDEYWTDRNRHPLFIMRLKKIVGFALIRKISDNEAFSFELSEFYILPTHRKKGYGRKAVSEVFSGYCGFWQLQVYVRNAGALSFWKRCIAGHAARQVRFERKQRKDAQVWQLSFVIEKNA